MKGITMRAERIVRFVGNSFEAGFEKVEFIVRFSKKIAIFQFQKELFKCKKLS